MLFAIFNWKVDIFVQMLYAIRIFGKLIRTICSDVLYAGDGSASMLPRALS